MTSEGLARRENSWILAREKLKIDTRAIHLTLSGITKPNGKWLSKASDVPQVIFVIGRLIIKSDATTPERVYQPTDYRAVLDLSTEAIWLLYEYYQFDPDFKAEMVEFCMNKTLEERVNQTFDTVKILDSIKAGQTALTPLQSRVV